MATDADASIIMVSEETKRELARFRAEQDVSEVCIWTMNKDHMLLYDVDGNEFEHVETNIWGRSGQAGVRRILYLGTGKHGDRVTLRPLYVKLDDGRWVNSTTAKDAPFPEERKAAW